jgi:hypothetical protein
MVRSQYGPKSHIPISRPITAYYQRYRMWEEPIDDSYELPHLLIEVCTEDAHTLDAFRSSFDAWMSRNPRV